MYLNFMLIQTEFFEKAEEEGTVAAPEGKTFSLTF